MEKREYIQLPALNRNISEEELLCIWEFAKLPGEVQEQMLDRVKGVLRKESIQKKIVPDGIYSVKTDRINRYGSIAEDVKTCNDRSMSAGSIYISRMLCIGNFSGRIETGVPGVRGLY